MLAKRVHNAQVSVIGVQAHSIGAKELQGLKPPGESTMKRKSLIAALALTVVPAFMASAATTFSFTFDNSFIDGIGTVGTGTFVSPIDLSPGTYDLASLGPFSVEFSFREDDLVFSTTDIVTPIDQVAVKITQFAPGVERLVFTASTPPPCCNPTTVLDLMNAAYSSLEFAATPDGGISFYEALGISTFFGNYLALSAAVPIVPEPSTWAMMLIGFLGLGFAGYRRAKAGGATLAA